MNICTEHSSNNTPMPRPAYENQRELAFVPVCNSGLTGLNDKATILNYK